MARLIDGDALLHALATQTMNNGKTDDMRKGVFAALEYCRQVIEMQPTIDAQPVRHGRWVKKETKGGGIYSACSECGAMMSLPWYWHCGKCGTLMDGGAENGWFD